MASIVRLDIWLADLNPVQGTEPGKVRPVLVVQSNALNHIPHPSTLICPITTKVTHAPPLRLNIPNMPQTGLNQASDVLIDQARAIDNRRLIRRIGALPVSQASLLNAYLKIVLGL